MAPVEISLHRVTKRFRRVPAEEVYGAHEFSLSVAPGELVTLLGPPGSGKSTVLRLIAGLERPESGTVRIDRRDATHLAPSQRGIVFEGAAGVEAGDGAAPPIMRSLRETLDRLGLRPDGGRRAGARPACERLQATLMRALARRPSILLLDEPLRDLDAGQRSEMREQIRALHRQAALTTILATRAREDAMAISDRIVVMDDGVVVQDGPPEELYYRPDGTFAARCVGRANLLRARVVSAFEVETHGVRLAIRSGCLPGSLVMLVVRPEMIELVPGAGPARIVQRAFAGERIDYQVDFDGEKLEVSTAAPPQGAPLAEGQTVEIRFDAGRIHVIG